LFGGGHDWTAFLRFNDAYRWQARVTLALHKNAALWQLPWEYLHNGHEFLARGGPDHPVATMISTLRTLPESASAGS
jgi:hypothetical protein